jgi:hypothetical protein
LQSKLGLPSDRVSHKQNLPASVSSFIGREQELRAIGQGLREHWLATLMTGNGRMQGEANH